MRISSFLPRSSSGAYPKILSVARFTERMMLFSSMVMIASGAVSARTRYQFALSLLLGMFDDWARG
jgi:hypothetical protein